MSSLKEQLVSLGLVDAETTKDSRGSFDKAMLTAPINRLGKPQTWYKWLVRKKLPKNMSERCCMCGEYGMRDTLERTSESKEAERKLRVLKKMMPSELVVCRLCIEGKDGE